MATKERERESHDAWTKDPCHFKSDEQRKKRPRQDKSPGCTSAPRQENDYLTEIIPGVMLLSNGSQQNQCLVQQVQERDSWLTSGRNTGATAPMVLSSRPSATLEAINRPDSAVFEITGRFMMRLVTSCITGRRPRALAGATLPRATVEATRQSVLTER